LFKLPKILLVKKYALPAISSRDDMLQSSWKMNPRFTCHGNWLSNEGSNVNTELPLPDPMSSSFPKKEYEGVKILSPAEFLEAVKEKI